MATFKCKMCGGQLEIIQGTTVCTCEYCGTQQTLPRLDSDKKENLYDRANHFRRNNDFDKAMSIYEQILNEDSTDAEAYWSILICNYGIEYVEDPSSHKRIPTVNRAQYTSIFDDENYKSALLHADTLQKSVYEQEAQVINEIQKGILSISSKEEPFDVFICYKESDEAGRRTPDSVLANDLYHQLTQEGFKVFFSRITLEDKLGQEYEPYIFAALNSSKVMVVLGTKPEYYNAVWVKNEWSRYLSLIKNGAKKMLIPAYKDMDPYDLPDEFSHLQAQDMSKLGFMQDLIRGIKKILGEDQPKGIQENVAMNNVVNNATNSNVVALLKRGNIALEDAEWEKADGFFEEVLNQDAENGEAYFGKFLSNYKASNIDKVKNDIIEKYDRMIREETLSAGVPSTDDIEAIVEKYTVSGYLEASEIWDMFEYDFSYKSILSSARTVKEQIINELKQDKIINHCQHYCTTDLKDKINNLFEEIERYYDAKIQQAEVRQSEIIERKNSDYTQFFQTKEQEVNNISTIKREDRENDYNDALKRLSNVSKSSDINTLIIMFEKIGDFNNSAELKEMLVQKKSHIDENEDKIKQNKEIIKKMTSDKLLSQSSIKNTKYLMLNLYFWVVVVFVNVILVFAPFLNSNLDVRIAGFAVLGLCFTFPISFFSYSKLKERTNQNDSAETIIRTNTCAIERRENENIICQDKLDKLYKEVRKLSGL